MTVATQPGPPIPAGLDDVERLMYRRGYSAAFGKYLKANGAPSLPGRDVAKLKTHAAAWHAEHDEARASAAHRAGLSAVRAYWKRHGITDRAHLLGKAPARRKPTSVTCQHCGRLTAVA